MLELTVHQTVLQPAMSENIKRLVAAGHLKDDESDRIPFTHVKSPSLTKLWIFERRVGGDCSHYMNSRKGFQRLLLLHYKKKAFEGRKLVGYLYPNSSLILYPALFMKCCNCHSLCTLYVLFSSQNCKFKLKYCC